MTKPGRRAQARAARRDAPKAPGAGRAIADRVLAMPEVGAAAVVAAYVAVGDEPPTAELVDELVARGVRVLLPVVLADLDLDWAAEDGTRTTGARGPEPAGPRLGRSALGAADVVLVPALAVDRTGRRLGQGGGSYDRALPRAARAALVVALLHDHELVADLPAEAHDVPVDAVVTPVRTVRMGRAR